MILNIVHVYSFFRLDFFFFGQRSRQLVNLVNTKKSSCHIQLCSMHILLYLTALFYEIIPTVIRAVGS